MVFVFISLDEQITDILNESASLNALLLKQAY